MVARRLVELAIRPVGCNMYDVETDTEISFEQIDGKDYTVVTIAGVLDLESAEKIGHLVNDTIPIEYDGNVIFDIRKVDDRLRNEDAEATGIGIDIQIRFLLGTGHWIYAFGVMHGRFLREFISSRCKRERRRQRMPAFRRHKDSDFLNVENSDRKVQNVVTDSRANCEREGLTVTGPVTSGV